VDIKNLPKEKVRFYFNNYLTAENRINLYSLFIEKGMSLLGEGGILTFINPNSILVNESYKKIRKLIVDYVKKIIKLPDSVFVAAVVETIILVISNNNDQDMILGKSFKKDDKIQFDNIQFENFSKHKWKLDADLRFNIFSSNETHSLLSKIENDCQQLSMLVDFSLGITPYDSYKGHSKDLISSKAYHCNEKISDEYVPLISGKNIHSYYISDDTSEYLRYGPWLGAPREQRFFESPKIVVRQILGGNNLQIIAGYTEQPKYFTQIGFSLISKVNDLNLLKYITAILNSNLMSYYHREKFLDKEKSVFQKILIGNCKTFPIKVKSSNKIIELIQRIVTEKRLNPFSDTTPIQQELDILIYKIYGLNYDDVVQIDPFVTLEDFNLHHCW
jgi:hypothetical protein